MAYSTITKPSLHFNTVPYQGNASYGHSITGVGFQPDWVWIKRRDGSARNHELYDAVRGTDKAIYSSSNAVEATGVNLLHSFDSDGFTVDDHAGINGNDSFVSWNWKAGGSTSANTDGSINSTVSANTTAGFSIVSFTGTGSNGTVGHGLGAVPKMIIQKNRSVSSAWSVWHNSFSGSQVIYLNETGAVGSNTSSWNSTVPTSSVFSVGTGSYPNGSGNNQIYYVFSEVKGYSKFGSYTGNGNADGTFVYTGFKPAMIIFKLTSGSDNWYLKDNKRDIDNPVITQLFPNLNNADNTNSSSYVDFLSNGFKFRGTDSGINGSGSSYIYMAFAEQPLVANVGAGIPATAR